MRNLLAIVCVLCVVAAIPVPESQPQSSLDLLQIPLSNGKVCIQMINLTMVIFIPNLFRLQTDLLFLQKISFSFPICLL